MSKIRGNIFNYDELNLHIDDTVPNMPKENNFSELIKYDCLKLINNIDIDNSPIETYELNNDNFKDYHYKLMKDKFLVIYPNNNKINYITADGLCFTCNDEKLQKLITNIPKPLKISFKYADETTMPLCLIIKILYGKDINNIDDLISIFASNPFNKSDLNCYRALIKIYRKLFDIINTHSYISYINRERDLYLIDYKSYLRSLEINTENELKNKELELESLRSKLLSNKDLNINKSTLLNYIEHNTDYPISLYEGISNPEFLKLYRTYSEVQLLKKLDIQNYLVNTYNYNGMITSKYPYNYIIQKNNNKIVRGKFPSIYFNTLLNILRLKNYVVSGDSDNYLINYIKSINTELDVSLITTILLVLEAYICQLTTTKAIKEYLFIYKSTILSDEDIEVFLEFIRDNLSELITSIDTFNSKTYKNYEVKLIEHTVFSPLNTRLLYITSKIIKTTALEIDKTLNDFNSKNKKHIYITDIRSDSIYLISHPDIVNIAIDILNRTMINSIKNNLKLPSYACYTDIL